MRYLVTVEVQKISTQVFSVEAATENEASLSAVKIVDALNGVTKADVLSVVEDPKNRNELERGQGYIARIL